MKEYFLHLAYVIVRMFFIEILANQWYDFTRLNKEMKKVTPYQALPKGLYVMNSPIAGQGIFTMDTIPAGTDLGMSHIMVDEEIYRTPLGGFINHSENPNCEKYLIGNKYYIRTIREVEPIEELVLKYTFYKVV